MDKDLIVVALRNGALYIEPERETVDTADTALPAYPNPLSATTLATLSELVVNGFSLTEDALHKLNRLCPDDQRDLLVTIRSVMASNRNWTPLVRNWKVPTHESFIDHLYTFYYNLRQGSRSQDANNIPVDESVLLPCGHYIPNGTFDLSRYTGCPFCGTPFEISTKIYSGQGSKFKVLKAWDEDDAFANLLNMLRSTVPLSAAQIDSLHKLLDVFEMPDGVDVPMRETAIAAASVLFGYDDEASAARLLKSPADVLRMIWFLQTDQLKIVRPKTIVRNAVRTCHSGNKYDRALARNNAHRKLRLKFSRKQCRFIAQVINSLDIAPDKACEIMHPYRGMWVRVIRAARLAEYARREGFERLRVILDLFYRGDYAVWQGEVNQALKRYDHASAYELLRQRPGAFARQLFAVMLDTNPYKTLQEFRTVLDKLPLRLIYNLANQAEIYFSDVEGSRMIRIVTGEEVAAPVNPKLALLPEDERKSLIEAISNLTLDALRERYAKNPMTGQKVYISPELMKVVLPVGDRPVTEDAVLVVPQGTVFPVLGDKIRLFLQWGTGLPAQHLDLDISAKIICRDKVLDCFYGCLSLNGAYHSGDMRSIPDNVGTAEYVELDLPTLREIGAEYVAFIANQYSAGSMLPNAIAGWMDSSFPMAIDEKTGVAYDPSCVQYMIKVPDNMITDGLVFGVLDVKRNEVIWLEMPFGGRNVLALNYINIITYIHKLSKKVTVGRALEVMARARGMVLVSKAELDVTPDHLRVVDPAVLDTSATSPDTVLVFDRAWVYDSAAVSAVLLPPAQE